MLIEGRKDSHPQETVFNYIKDSSCRRRICLEREKTDFGMTPEQVRTGILAILRIGWFLSPDRQLKSASFDSVGGTKRCEGGPIP